jgi:hypothetical protein
MAPDGGAVLYRDKRVAPKYWHLLFGLPTLLTLAGVPMTLLHVGNHPAPLWMAAIFPVFAALLALLWVGMSVLRVTVSNTDVNVQYGLFGPKIPLAAIRSAAAVSYNWAEFGGWGIRRSLGGTWAYTLPGDGGRAVKIVWTDGKGVERSTLIGCGDPDALAAAIERACARTGARVEPAASRAVLTPRGETQEAAEQAREADAAGQRAAR